MDAVLLLSQVITAATPALVPALVAAVKTLLPRVPKAALPALAIALGAGIDLLNAYVTGGGLGGPWGAVLGAMGIVVREVFVGVRRTLAGES